MGTDILQGTVKNGDSVVLVHGMITRVVGDNSVVRAQADTTAHLQGLYGVVTTGSAAPGSSAVVCATNATKAKVLLETGLTPSAGQTLYVSATVAGSATNAAPANAVAIGVIEDASSYAIDGRVYTDVQITAGIGSSGTPIVMNGILTGVNQLASLSSSGFGETQDVWVESVQATFQLLRGNLVVDNITVVAASGKPGFQWVRSPDQNVIWQRQLTWSVDPQNVTANDENTGIDDANPLKTMAELARRVRGAVYLSGSSCVVRLLSSMQNGDGAFFDVRGSGTPGGVAATPFPVNSFFTIVGIPTVLYTGTITAPAQTNAGGVGDNHYTDAAAPIFTTGSRIWTRTNTSLAYFWPQKDLTGGVWRVSQPTHGLAQATLADGDTWQIQQLPTIQDIRFPETHDWNQYLIALVNVNDTSASASYTSVRWSCVQFQQAGFLFGADLHNCRDFIKWASTTAISPMLSVRGGLETVFGLIAAGSAWTFAANSIYTSFQGIALQFDNATTVAESRLMFYDLSTACITLVNPNARMGINSVGGSGNSGVVISVTGSFCSVQTRVLSGPAVPAGMTSSINLFQVNATSSATVPVVDTTILSQIQ